MRPAPLVAPAITPTPVPLNPSRIDEVPLDRHWRERAVCKGKGKNPQDIKKWFPGPGGSQEGKQYCAVCPVARECKNYADHYELEWGIWGGEIRRRSNMKEHA